MRSGMLLGIMAGALLLATPGYAWSQDDDPAAETPDEGVGAPRPVDVEDEPEPEPEPEAPDTSSTEATEEENEATANEERACSGLLDEPYLEPTGDQLRVYPSAVNLCATRGDREVLIRGSLWLAWPSPADGAEPDGRVREESLVSIRPLDLVAAEHSGRIRADRMDRRSRLTGGSMEATYPAPGWGTPVPWTVVVPLDGVRSGTYHGILLATRDSDTNLAHARPPVDIPVTLFVRDAPWWALAIFALGLPLVGFLRTYRDRRLATDQVYLRIDDAADSLQDDEQLTAVSTVAAPFWRTFEGLIVEALAALGGPRARASSPAQIEAAGGKLEEFETLRTAWFGGRRDWLAGAATDHATLAGLRLLDLQERAAKRESSHRAKLIETTEGEYEKAPELAKEQGAAAAPEYAKLARQRASRASRYLDFLTLLDTVAAGAGTIADAAAQKKFRDELSAIRGEWNAVADPTDDAAVEATRAELEKRTRDAKVEAGQGGRLPGETELEAMPSETEAFGTVGDVPDLIPRIFHRRIRSARSATRAYAVAVSLLVYVTLSFIGLNETWGGSLTFGADRLKDYLSVVTWMLGANTAALASFGALTREWALPWLSRVVAVVDPGAERSRG